MGMDEVDHYVMLGLPSGEKGAKLSEEDIRKAYLSKLIVLHPDKRPDDPNAHHNFLKLQASYETLMDKNARQTFHQHHEEEKRIKRRRNKSQHCSKRHRKSTDVIHQREQAARAADTAARQARDMEEEIRTRNEQLIARIKRDAAPPAASTLNKRTPKEPASTQCPNAAAFREFTTNFSSAAAFEEHENSLLTKFCTRT